MQKTPEPTPVQPRPPKKEVAPPKKDTPTLDTAQKKTAATLQKKPDAEEGKDIKQTLGETKPTPKETSQLQPHMAKVPIESQKTDTQDKPGFFGFGFGGARSRSPSPQPAASAVSGKVLGFGSSIINSASSIISSAVQDESSTTPSSSRKASMVSQMSDKTPPTSRKGSAISQTSNKVNTTPSSSRKGSVVSQTSVKTHTTSQKESAVALNSEGTKPELAEKQKETTAEKQVEQTSKDELLKKATPQQEPVSSKPPEETGFFSKSQSPLHQPTASAVSGKVLGFGSSLFSSASNLISSALDETTTSPPALRKGSTSSQLSNKTNTPPSSRKGSSVSQTSDNITTPPSSRKGSVKTSTPQDFKAPSKPIFSDDKKVHPTNVQEQIKTDDKKSDVSPAQTTTELLLKDMPPKTTKTELTNSLPKICPLCMVDLKTDPPNYNKCTECKNTVCTLCGFNPMPIETEVSRLFALKDKYFTVIIIIILSCITIYRCLKLCCMCAVLYFKLF